MSQLLSKIRQAQADIDREKDQQIAEAWAAIWPAIIRSVAGTEQPEDDQNTIAALATLEFFEVITDPAATIDECTLLAGDAYRREVDDEKYRECVKKTSAAKDDLHRFERFAAKVIDRLRRRAGQYRHNGDVGITDVKYIRDLKYKSLFSHEGRRPLLYDDQTAIKIREQAKAMLADYERQAEAFALPPKFVEFIDEFNVEHPNYLDRRDAGYKDRLQGVDDGVKGGQLKASIAVLEDRIQYLNGGDWLKSVGDTDHYEAASRLADFLEVECPVEVYNSQGEIAQRLNLEKFAVLKAAAKRKADLLTSEKAGLIDEIKSIEVKSGVEETPAIEPVQAPRRQARLQTPPQPTTPQVPPASIQDSVTEELQQAADESDVDDSDVDEFFYPD